MTAMLPSDWDDERLAAAFAARADAVPATPPDIAAAVIERLARQPRPTIFSVRRVAPVLGAAAAMTLAVIVAAGQLLNTAPAASVEPTSVNAPTASSASEVPKPSTAVTVAEMLGRTLSVTEAAAIRDRGIDSREIVVSGLLAPPVVHACVPVPQRDEGGTTLNPSRLDCPDDGNRMFDAHGVPNPSGRLLAASIQPSFALTAYPASQKATDGIQVTLVGHFDDRRAGLCEAADRDACSSTFVVDRVAAVDGVEQPIATTLRTDRWDEATQTTVTEHPKDLEEDVDRLVLGVAPQAIIESRQLVTINHVIPIEPVLADDNFVPYVGNPTTLVWLVTAVDLRDGVPVARTFALFDGSNWFAEVTAGGAVMHDRQAAAGPSSGPQSPLPSGDPAAFDSAPTTVLGIPVRDIATLMHDRRADFGDLGRDEMAIRAWYVGPNPATPCEPAAAAIHPPLPPCDQARHWLLDGPGQFGDEIGQLRTNPEHWPPVLNPLLPVDVPFDVQATWVGDVANPVPVIVFGHFEDIRVDTYAGNVYFVLDALAWMRDRPVGTLDTLTRLTSAATEDPASVLARVGDVSPNDAIATWTTAVDAADFTSMDPRTAAAAPEFTSGRPVWIVRRLIRNEMDGRLRVAIEWAYTADQGTRVWWTEMPDSPADLATSIDLRNPDSQTTIVRVFDYDQQIRSVHSTAGLASLKWRRIGPDVQAGLQVAHGRSDREVAVRWTAGACGPEWQIRVYLELDGQILIEPSRFGDPCGTRKVVRQILLTFDEPTDLDHIRTGDPCCG